MFRRNIFMTLAVIASLTICLNGCQAMNEMIGNSPKGRSIVEFGAVGDGETMNTDCIQMAIDAIAADGGGALVVPEGVFMSGALFLKPGVNVHIEKGGVLKGSPDIADFPMTRTRIEGHFQDWTPALINAEGCDGLVIDGEGEMNGSGKPYHYAFRSTRKADRSTKNLDVPRPRLLFISSSNNVIVSGLRLHNSGFWNLHLYKCQHVLVDGLDIEAPEGSPSTDGVDIDSCQWVTVQNTTIANNDDAICLKGTKGVDALEDKDSPPVEHIVIRNCLIKRSDSLVTCGSEATIVRDVLVENCTVAGPKSKKVKLLRFKLRSDTQQLYENFILRDITLDGHGQLINWKGWTQYEDLKGRDKPTHTVRNVTMKNIHGKYGSFGTIRFGKNDTAESITFENIDLQLDSDDIPSFAAIDNLTIKNVKVNGREISAE